MKTPIKPPSPTPVAAVDDVAAKRDEYRDIDQKTYARYMRLGQALLRNTNLNIKFTQQNNALHRGDIFLFNHFTRLETIFPQTILFNETGGICRTIAHHALFAVNKALADFFDQTGVIPSNTPNILPFLAAEILRGRKVVIFPEGGMVKDRQVVNEKGELEMFSSSAKRTRKPHRGAAALALNLDLIKHKLRQAFQKNDREQIMAWCQNLQMNEAQLQAVSLKPTLIVPGNITYYPIRTGENILTRALEKLMDRPPAAAVDELTIEGNIFLNQTDVDIAYGKPLQAIDKLSWTEEQLLNLELGHTHAPKDVFALTEEVGGISGIYFKRFIDRHTDRIREEYSRAIYENATVNLNHLIAVAILSLVRKNTWDVPASQFHRIIYAALKDLQQQGLVNLHCSLRYPDAYQGVLTGTNRGLLGFIESCARAELVRLENGAYHFDARINQVSGIDTVRLDNPIHVHANEVALVPAVKHAVEQAINHSRKLTALQIAEWQFEDELTAYHGLRRKYENQAPETMIAAMDEDVHAPYWLKRQHSGKKGERVGVLLVHGFANSPRELKEFGVHLHQQGYDVLGMRLAGHGTSWLDLETRSRQDWVASVRHNYSILAALVDRVVIVGFSTGGALAAHFANEKPDKLSGIVMAAAPVLVQDKNMNLLPLVMGFRSIFGRLPGLRKALRYYPFGKGKGGTYTQVSVRSLNELRKVSLSLSDVLGHIKVPVLVMQGLQDQTVQPKSAQIVFDCLASPDKELVWIDNSEHGLIELKIGKTWEYILGFVERLQQPKRD